MPKLLDQETVRHHLNYNPLTGEFRWRYPTSFRVRCGDLAGHDSQGKNGKLRVVIGLHGRLYRAARLAWLYMTGNWPVGVVDHRDNNYRNHSWDNLRDVSNQVNIQNQTKAAVSNKSSGLLGVTWDRRKLKWKAQIKVDRKNYNLGEFDSPAEAHEAYVEAKRRLHVGCTI